jgi:hypothetical protein
MALGGSVVPAHAATAPAWHQVYSHHFGPAATDYSSFTSVVAIGGADVWALGGSDLSGGNGATPQAVAVQWTKTGWTANKVTVAVPSYISAASGSAANNIWAVTFYGGYVLHYNGSKWSVAKKLSANGLLDGVVALAPNNVWVFGTSGYGPGDGTWHYDGSAWKHWTGKYDAITGASAISAKDIWGLASVNAPGDTLVRFNGTAWVPQTANGIPAGMHLGTLYPVSDKNVWATASQNKNNSNIPYVLHFNGTSWTPYTLPWTVASGDTSSIGSPAPDGAGGLWFTLATIHYGAGNAFTRKYYVVHRSATGTWGRIQTGSEVDAPSGSGTTLTDTVSGASLGDLALIPGTKNLAGAGIAPSHNDTSSNAVVWAYGSI